MPGGVKEARRLVKPFGVGASPTLAATSNAEGRIEKAGVAELRGIRLATLTISDGWQSSNAPVLKTESGPEPAWVRSLHHPPLS